MTKEQLRELDAWIAEHGMGWKPEKAEDSETLIAWLSYDEELEAWTWTGFWNDSPDAYRYNGELHWKLDDGSVMTASGVDGLAWEPTRKAGQLRDVKREIERRGWSWGVNWLARREDKRFLFGIYKPMCIIPYEIADVTEELAGCLAFKAAVEAAGGEGS